MKRDKLLRQLSALPIGTDIGVQIGADRLDVIGIVPWGGGRFAALRCRPGDLRDLLVAWGLPAALREELAPGPTRRQPAPGSAVSRPDYFRPVGDHPGHATERGGHGAVDGRAKMS